MKRILTTSLIAAACLLGANSARAEHYALKTCIVSDESLSESTPVPVTYQGKTYLLCCKSCVKKFNANPQKYIAVYQKEAKHG